MSDFFNLSIISPLCISISSSDNSGYRDLKKDVKEQYGVTLTKIRAIGFSAMMHGYLAFDKAGELLVPFRK